MITIHEWNETSLYDNMGLGVLHEAQEVHIQQEINGDYRLVFEYPIRSEKYDLICENRIVKCEGQIFRINRIEEKEETLTAAINAMHIYSDTEDHHSHIQHIKNYMGYTPYQIMTGAEMAQEFKELGFHVLRPNELPDGMEWIDGKIDFWEQSKTNANKVIRTIVENAGWGEIYKDGRNVAIVKRLGKDAGLRLDVQLNMIAPQKTTEITELVTRLYPYGQNDLHIGSVNGGVQYIDSPNVAKYGVRKGYLDYSDIDTAADLLARAQWEFDAQNEQRIDVPALTIEAKALDLSVLPKYEKLPTIRIGDTVRLYSKDLGLDGLQQRITSMDWYPYEPEKSTVRIGRVKKDMFFYLMQNHKLTHKYDKASNNNGDVKTNWLAGIISSDRNKVRSDNKQLILDGDLLTIKDDTRTRIQIGNLKGEFVFIIYDKQGGKAVMLNERGEAVFKGSIETKQNCKISGELCVGLKGDTEETGISFYGDAMVSDSKLYGRIVPYGLGDLSEEELYGINITDGLLYEQGVKVATTADLGLLKSKIIAEVKDDVRRMISDAIANHISAYHAKIDG